MDIIIATSVLLRKLSSFKGFEEILYFTGNNMHPFPTAHKVLVKYLQCKRPVYSNQDLGMYGP